MNKRFLLRIHLSMLRRSFPSRHCPNNCLYATYSAVFQIALNIPDTLLKCIDSPDHCDAIVPLSGDGEQGLDQVLVPPTPRHNYPTWTSLPPFVSKDPESLQDRAILV